MTITNKKAWNRGKLIVTIFASVDGNVVAEKEIELKLASTL